MTDGSGPVRVVVAVLTYKRPGDLAEVLPQLVQQARDVPEGFVADVLVVDNDPAAGARDQVLTYAVDQPITIRYEHEPEPGIAAARNLALDAAAEHRLLVYIDDDERPQDRWLHHLIETWVGHGAAAVVGPVVSTFAVEPPAFVTAGRFFDRRRLPTGTAVTVAATNNLLLDLDLVRAAGLRFDMTLGTVGGSDTLFTRGLVRAGGRMVWCDEAIVFDVVPADRTTTSWNLRRALRSGNSWSVTALRLERGGPVQRVRLAGRGAVRVGGGAARAAWGVFSRDPAHRARGIRSVARGTGMLMGASGLLYREYKRKA